MILKNIKTKTFLLLVISVVNFPLEAIQSSTAHICTTLVASLCAGGSYKIVHDMPGKIHPAILAGASCLATLATYYVLYQATPAGRIRRANLLLTDLSRHTFARVHFDTDHAFFDAVQDVYLTYDLPLMSAYNHLVNLIPAVHYAFGLINKATAEVRKDVLLQEECDASLSCANKLFKNISDAIKRIREHKDYLSQLSIYKESLFQAQQTIAQQQMASAQQDIAHAQQGTTVLQWIKLLFGFKK